MSKHHILIIGLGFAVGLAVAACVTTTDPNPLHCRNAQGDQTCAERYGEGRSFCTTASCDGSSEQFYGCVAARPTDDCYYPCGDDNDVMSDDSCLFAGDGETNGDGDMTSGPGNTADGDGDGDPGGDGDTDTSCMSSADCSDETPFCDLDAGACVGCSSTEDPDGACAGLDAELSVCAADTCVACTPAKSQACGENTPVCDAQTNVCVGCSAHEQCPASACDLGVGSCFDPATTLHVDGDADCNGADGTQDLPYCQIDIALAFAADQALIILHENEGQEPYEESNLITKSIALLAAETEHPVIEGLAGQAPLEVRSSGQLFARGLELSETEDNALGLIIDGGAAWVEQSKIIDNNGGGILVKGGGTLMLVNSFVGGNIEDETAIEVSDGEASVIFSTIAAGYGDSRAFVCAEGSVASIRNSIVVSKSSDPEIDCASVQVVHSFTEIDSDESFDSGWFADFGGGDFHLEPDECPETIQTAGIWKTGDPTIDIDGDPRPLTNGAPEFVGADRVP